MITAVILLATVLAAPLVLVSPLARAPLWRASVTPLASIIGSGFGALERLEQLSVALKLAVIAGLLAALWLFFAECAGQGALVFAPPQQTGWSALALGFGLIVTVQGFETSRYLGARYDADLRIRSSRRAGWR